MSLSKLIEHRVNVHIDGRVFDAFVRIRNRANDGMFLVELMLPFGSKDAAKEIAKTIVEGKIEVRSDAEELGSTRQETR